VPFHYVVNGLLRQVGQTFTNGKPCQYAMAAFFVDFKPGIVNIKKLHNVFPVFKKRESGEPYNAHRTA